MNRRLTTLTAATLFVATFALAVVYADGRVVSQKGKKFSLETLTVKPGEEVTFVNDDGIPHNVYSSTKGLEFNLKAQDPGTSAGQTFASEGVAEVRCAFHPSMKLTVTIKK
jgi:plastocyanin